MFYLLATILTNTILIVLFKVFPRYKVDNLQAIVVNYCTCVVTGCIFLGEVPFAASDLQEPWLPWSVLMGLMFISIFNLLAYRTREDGITPSAIANKLSLIIPVIFSVFLYGDRLTWLGIAGIVIAFPAVWFTSAIPGQSAKPRSIFWPALLFVTSGLLDTLVKFVQHNFLQDERLQPVFTVHAFLTAAFAGVILVLVLYVRGSIVLKWRNVLAGILLGVPNYFSLYFLIRLLHSGFLQSAAAIPVNNIGIVLCSALTAIFLFKEKATGKRILGLILSVIAILLIALNDLHARSL